MLLSSRQRLATFQDEIILSFHRRMWVFLLPMFDVQDISAVRRALLRTNVCTRRRRRTQDQTQTHAWYSGKLTQKSLISAAPTKFHPSKQPFTAIKLLIGRLNQLKTRYIPLTGEQKLKATPVEV